MARWIEQTLHVNDIAEIVLMGDGVAIQCPGPYSHIACVTLRPENRDDAAAMSIVLRLAAKRLEDIGKGLV